MKRFIGLFTTCIFSVGLSACASFGSLSHNQKVELSCANVSSAVSVLAYARAQNKLSVQEISAVNSALEITTPICTSDTSPTTAELTNSAFANAADVLANIAVNHGAVK